MFAYFFLFVTVVNQVLAVPVVIQDAVSSLVPDSLETLKRQVLDFLNPFHSPSVNQAIVSCLILIILSSVAAGPPTISYPKDATRTKLFSLRVNFLLYGLLAPDLFAIHAWFGRITEACMALIYDRRFNRDAPKKYKWTAVHGAFMMKRGFVLWEDTKPAKVLGLVDLLRLVKSGEVELPPLSKQDIFDRSVRARGHVAVWFLVLPHYWFVRKFIFVLPAMCLFSVTHAMLTWYTFFWQSTTIASVVEPVVLFRKAPDFKEKLVAEAVTDDLERAQSDGFDKAVDAVIRNKSGSTDPYLEKDVQTESETFPQLDSKSSQSRLTAALDVVCCLLVGVSIFIFNVFLAITSPMRSQWRTISGQRDISTLGRYIAGTVVTLLGWGGYVFASKNLTLPSDLECRIWYAASLFVVSQPVLLLLAPRWIRSRLRSSVKTGLWAVYNLAYAAARLSIYIIAFRTMKMPV